MKALLLTALLTAAPAAASDLLSVPGLAQLAAEKAKEAQAIGTLTLSLKKGAGAYLPIWTYRSGEVRYARTGIGWEGTDLGGHPLVPLTLNLPALSGRLWSSAWALAHIERAKLPDIWFGPTIRVPLIQDKFRWEDWRDYVGFAASVGFGK